MKQLTLFDKNEAGNCSLATNVQREGNRLVIPEGLHTIPCTHGIHRFPGKFIPNIPRYLLREILPCDGNRVVFDPFCGSGTTLIESALEGRKFLGMDIDPLSVMISNAKTQVFSEPELNSLEAFWSDHNYKVGQPDVIPEVPNLSHWFSDRAVIELSSIKKRSELLSEKQRIFSLVVFSSIIRRVSNADDQSQKTYVSHTLPKNPPAPSELFPIFLKRAISGMREYSSRITSKPRGKVIRGDVRTDITDITFDDIITSPPYIDSLDYVYNQMLEYFWLLPELGISSYDNYRDFRKKPMGFNENFKLDSETKLSQYLAGSADEFRSVCQSIAENSPKEAKRVYSFFHDYAAFVMAVRPKQKPGAYHVCVIGNSHIRGVTVPTANFLTSIYESFGYTLRHHLVYDIKRHYMKFPRRENSGKIKEDHILIFEVE